MFRAGDLVPVGTTLVTSGLALLAEFFTLPIYF